MDLSNCRFRIKNKNGSESKSLYYATETEDKTKYSVIKQNSWYHEYILKEELESKVVISTIVHVYDGLEHRGIGRYFW